MAHEWNELNPFPWYADKRENEPVYFDPATGQWNAFQYDDVTRVLSDYGWFSPDFSGGRHSYDNPISASLISTDPPRHRELRTLVSQAFTPLLPRSTSRTVGG